MIFYPKGAVATATWTDENGKSRRSRFVQDEDGRLVNKFTDEIPGNARITVSFETAPAIDKLCRGDHLDYCRTWRPEQIDDVKATLERSYRTFYNIVEALASGALADLPDNYGNEIEPHRIAALIEQLVQRTNLDSRAVEVARAITRRMRQLEDNVDVPLSVARPKPTEDSK